MKGWKKKERDFRKKDDKIRQDYQITGNRFQGLLPFPCVCVIPYMLFIHSFKLCARASLLRTKKGDFSRSTPPRLPPGKGWGERVKRGVTVSLV